jgi:hypothetical protein
MFEQRWGIIILCWYFLTSFALPFYEAGDLSSVLAILIFFILLCEQLLITHNNNINIFIVGDTLLLTSRINRARASNDVLNAAPILV